jgi:hypothetical protein
MLKNAPFLSALFTPEIYRTPAVSPDTLRYPVYTFRFFFNRMVNLTLLQNDVKKQDNSRNRNNDK